MDVTGTVGGWRPRSPALSGAASGSSGDLAQPHRPPPDSPGAEHSRPASSTRPRLFMAAGGMLRAGLGKARGLWAEVLRGAGLARRSLGHEPQPPAEPEAPSPFPGREGNLPPRPASESPAREGGPGEGVVRELEKPHPQPIPQSVHHRSIPSRENRSAVSGRVTARNAPTRSWHLWGGG